MHRGDVLWCDAIESNADSSDRQFTIGLLHIQNPRCRDTDHAAGTQRSLGAVPDKLDKGLEGAAPPQTPHLANDEFGASETFTERRFNDQQQFDDNTETRYTSEPPLIENWPTWPTENNSTNETEDPYYEQSSDREFRGPHRR